MGAVSVNIGLFTDTYFPQVSGVATSIKTLRDELTAQGHNVYIFTTTDPKAKEDDVEAGIYRFPSIPFVSFTERRIAVRGAFRAVHLAKRFQLDVVHNQTEFALGMMGKIVAHELKIPCLHTYHTMYQDYLHYIANGHIVKPKNVATYARLYMKNMDGIVAPSERVLDTLRSGLVRRFGSFPPELTYGFTSSGILPRSWRPYGKSTVMSRIRRSCCHLAGWLTKRIFMR